MKRYIAVILIWALVLVGAFRPVHVHGAVAGSTQQNAATTAPDGQLTNTREIPATGPSSPPSADGESWWQQLVGSIGDWFADRWQAIQVWWQSLPNWAKGLAVGLIAALVIIAVVVAVVLAGVALPVLAIVAIVGAIVGVIVAGLWYGLTEKGAFSITKALTWVLLGGIAGAAAFALVWEVAPAAWSLLVEVDAIVSQAAARAVSTVVGWVTSLFAPVGAYLAPRLAPIVAAFSGVAAWFQRVLQPIVNVIGPRWAAMMERLAPITTAIALRLQWFMQVTGLSRVLDWVNTLFIRLGIWFEGFVVTAPRLILSTISGMTMAGIYLATTDTVRLNELIESFLIGFAISYVSMLPTYTVTLAEAQLIKNFLKESGVSQARWNEIVTAFSRNVTVEELSEDLIVYRYYGGAGNPRGRWLTQSPLKDPVNELALPPGSTAEHVTRWLIPKGTKVLRGPVAPNFGRPGGATQIYLPDPDVLQGVSP